MSYLMRHPGYVLWLTAEHVEIVAAAVMIAVCIGLPVGILLTRLRWLEAPVINAAGILYSIPSLALFAVLIPLTGLGNRPTIVALVVYSLLVLIRNTIVGIRAVNPAVVDAARGIGMTGRQRLWLVELPLGLPVIVAGVRVATVASIGIATIAAYVGAGGLGILIFDGIRTLTPDTVVAGALAASALSLAADWTLLRAERAVRKDVAARGRA